MKIRKRRARLIVILATMASTAQTSNAEPEQLLTFVKELKVQQVQVADNQTKIDVKIADLAETVRIARLYASRLGGKRKPFTTQKK